MKQNVSARILAHSINPRGIQLLSFLLRYPRFIHAELMTHRALSRNAASSRAIPFAKMVAAIRAGIAAPEYWSREHKGMQPQSAFERDEFINQWNEACFEAIFAAEAMFDRGLAKSIVNRIVEPFSHMEAIFTGTEWGWANFFHLRASVMAEPTFQVLAFRALNQYAHSTPKELDWGHWHIPHFEGATINPGEETLAATYMLEVATARCARLSYLTHDGDHLMSKDIAMHDKLAQDGHWSPFEHCAQAISDEHRGIFQSCPWSNFDLPGTRGHSGWGQYRKKFRTENITGIDAHAILATKPSWITL